jgi:hypothetical protein
MLAASAHSPSSTVLHCRFTSTRGVARPIMARGPRLNIGSPQFAQAVHTMVGSLLSPRTAWE